MEISFAGAFLFSIIIHTQYFKAVIWVTSDVCKLKECKIYES
jgi:hypothetical protein